MTDNLELSERLRLERARRARPGWLARASERLGLPLTEANLLALDETLPLRDAFYVRVRTGDTWRFNLELDRRDPLFARIRALRLDGDIVALTSADRDIGALVLPAAVALGSPRALWDASREDLAIVTLDMRAGLCVGIDYYDLQGESRPDGIIEVVSWGALRIDAL